MTVLIKKPDKSVAFAKWGFFGAPGTGKTTTTAILCADLACYLANLGFPVGGVLMADTDYGYHWIEDIYAGKGIPFEVADTRNFGDLFELIEIAERRQLILNFDVITHFWENLKASAEEAKRLRLKKKESDVVRLEMNDIQDIKKRWKPFTDRYLGGDFHGIMCGRSGNIFDFQENEETGKRELITTGTRMAAEKNLGYECHLLAELFEGQTRDGIYHPRGFVWKDRSRTVMGQEIDFSFKTFIPHLKKLNIGGRNAKVKEDVGAVSFFPIRDRDDRRKQRQIVLDEIESVLLDKHPSQSAEDKTAKRKLVEQFFNTKSRTELEDLMSLEDLIFGYDRLHRHLFNNKPSRYTEEPAVIAAQTPVEEDGIPDFGEAAPQPEAGAGKAGTSESDASQSAEASASTSIMERAVAVFGQEKVTALSEDLKKRYKRPATNPEALKEALEARLADMLAKKEAEPEPEPAKGKAAEALAGKALRVETGSARVSQAGKPSQGASAKSDFNMALNLAFAGLPQAGIDEDAGVDA